MTSIAGQGTAQLGGRGSVLARQKAEHVRLHELLQALGRVRGTAEEELALLRVQRLVFPHAFAEEAVLWPALRRVLPDGNRWTTQVEQEHQEVNELFTRLDRGRPGDPGREELLERLVTVLDEDVRDEEDQLLPRLQLATGPRRLRALGLAWEAVRRVAPTRPHPTAARRPPGNALSALPLTVLDRLRDAATEARWRLPRLALPLRLLDRGLAALAGAVERLPVMRVGEDPSTHRPPGVAQAPSSRARTGGADAA